MGKITVRNFLILTFLISQMLLGSHNARAGWLEDVKNNLKDLHHEVLRRQAEKEALREQERAERASRIDSEIKETEAYLKEILKEWTPPSSLEGFEDLRKRIVTSVRSGESALLGQEKVLERYVNSINLDFGQLHERLARMVINQFSTLTTQEQARVIALFSLHPAMDGFFGTPSGIEALRKVSTQVSDPEVRRFAFYTLSIFEHLETEWADRPQEADKAGIDFYTRLVENPTTDQEVRLMALDILEGRDVELTQYPAAFKAQTRIVVACKELFVL